MKKQYEKPAVSRRQIKLENTIAGSTPVGPSNNNTPTVEDWEENTTGIGDNWGASGEWKW